jgi:hypothetical protein
MVLRACDVIYWLALVLWAGGLLSTGVAAIATFATLPDPQLGLSLAEFAEFDPSRHGHLAAGRVMEPVFTAIDFLQIVVGPLALVTLLVQLVAAPGSWTRPANLVRAACIVAALALAAGHVALMAPRMNRNLHEYWNAARAGDAAAAEVHHRAFDADHRVAEPLLMVRLFIVLVAVGASAVALAPVTTPRAGGLETPGLVSRR